MSDLLLEGGAGADRNGAVENGRLHAGLVERTAAAILALLLFLLVMNASAILLRRHFERRW